MHEIIHQDTKKYLLIKTLYNQMFLIILRDQFGPRIFFITCDTFLLHSNPNFENTQGSSLYGC